MLGRVAGRLLRSTGSEANRRSGLSGKGLAGRATLKTSQRGRSTILGQFSGNQKNGIEAKRTNRRANFVSIYGIH